MEGKKLGVAEFENPNSIKLNKNKRHYSIPVIKYEIKLEFSMYLWMLENWGRGRVLNDDEILKEVGASMI